MKRILVLTDHMPWGHRSIALAIFAYLKDQEKTMGWRVDYAQAKAETGLGGDLYNLVYRYVPSAHVLMHKASFSKTFQKLAEEVPMASLPAVKKVVNKYKPDIIISTYFLHSHCLIKWREQAGLHFKVWTVVADPWTINGVSLLEKADMNIVYDEVVAREARKLGIPPSKILKTGWWTRPEMYLPYDKDASRRKLGMEGTYPIIFIGGGSLGTSALPKILPVLPFVKNEVGIIFNCGTDKMTYQLVEYYQKLLHSVMGDKLKVHIKNYSWIERINEVLAACDIVFGKAGPNFLFDVVAMGKPFVAITHINGQENGNLDLIRKKKLGWVKEDPADLNHFFFDYIKRPEFYNQMYTSTIMAEAAKNKMALEKIKNALSGEELQ